MKIILRGCDRERLKSKRRRKNMKHAKVTTNLKKNNRKIETEREELQESAKCNYQRKLSLIGTEENLCGFCPFTQRYTELKEGNEKKIKGLEETMTSQRNQVTGVRPTDRSID